MPRAAQATQGEGFVDAHVIAAHLAGAELSDEDTEILTSIGIVVGPLLLTVPRLRGDAEAASTATDS